MTLSSLKSGERVKVVNILGGRGVRQHLNKLGIHIGDTLVIIHCIPFRGPIVVEIHGIKVALGRGISLKIEVEKI